MNEKKERGKLGAHFSFIEGSSICPHAQFYREKVIVKAEFLTLLKIIIVLRQIIFATVSNSTIPNPHNNICEYHIF